MSSTIGLPSQLRGQLALSQTHRVSRRWSLRYARVMGIGRPNVSLEEISPIDGDVVNCKSKSRGHAFVTIGRARASMELGGPESWLKHEIRWAIEDALPGTLRSFTAAMKYGLAGSRFQALACCAACNPSVECHAVFTTKQRDVQPVLFHEICANLAAIARQAWRRPAVRLVMISGAAGVGLAIRY